MTYKRLRGSHTSDYITSNRNSFLGTGSKKDPPSTSCIFLYIRHSLRFVTMNNSKNLKPVKYLNDKQYFIFMSRHKAKILSQSNNNDYKTNLQKLRSLDTLITNILDMSKDITDI